MRPHGAVSQIDVPLGDQIKGIAAAHTTDSSRAAIAAGTVSQVASTKEASPVARADDRRVHPADLSRIDPDKLFGSYLRAMPSRVAPVKAQNRATSTVSGRVGELRGSHAAVVDIRSRECDSTLVSKQPQIHKPARKGGEVHSYGFKTRMLQPAEAERSNAVVMNCCSGDPVNTRSAADLDIAFAEISPGIERWVPGLCKSKLRTVSSSRCPRLVPVGQ